MKDSVYWLPGKVVVWNNNQLFGSDERLVSDVVDIQCEHMHGHK